MNIATKTRTMALMVIATTTSTSVKPECRVPRLVAGGDDRVAVAVRDADVDPAHVGCRQGAERAGHHADADLEVPGGVAPFVGREAVEPVVVVDVVVEIARPFAVDIR